MPEAKRLIINGKVYSYLEYGEGEDLVLLHGWCNQSSDYIKLIIELGKHYHVYAPDLPNFGKSQTKDLFSLKTYFWFLDIFIKKLFIKDPLILGHSFGGVLALQYAFEQKVRGLILINSTGLQMYKHLLVLFMNLVSNSLYETLTATTTFLGIFINWFKNNIRYVFNKRFWKLLLYVLNNDYPNLELIDTEILILWSKGDRIFSHDYPHSFEKRLNNAQLELLPGGHFGCLVHPEKFVDEIVKKFT